MSTAANADAAARACIEMWRPFVEVMPGAWMEERDGVAAVYSGVPGTGFNGVWVEAPATPPEIVSELLDRVEAAGVPYCLQLRAGAHAGLTELARRRGLVFDGEEPTMVLEEAPALVTAEAPGLTIEQLGPRDGIVHARIAAHAFGTSVEVFADATTEAILSVPGIRAYAGFAGGEAVTSAVAVTYGGVTGVLAVGTLSDHRRRGYAGAVTARAALDGFSDGASWAWLQSDPSAVRVYERIGFRAVDKTALWIRE